VELSIKPKKGRRGVKKENGLGRQKGKGENDEHAARDTYKISK
jgi:hypothetical protein